MAYPKLQSRRSAQTPQILGGTVQYDQYGNKLPGEWNAETHQPMGMSGRNVWHPIQRDPDLQTPQDRARIALEQMKQGATAPIAGQRLSNGAIQGLNAIAPTRRTGIHAPASPGSNPSGRPDAAEEIAAAVNPTPHPAQPFFDDLAGRRNPGYIRPGPGEAGLDNPNAPGTPGFQGPYKWTGPSVMPKLAPGSPDKVYLSPPDLTLPPRPGPNASPRERNAWMNKVAAIDSQAGTPMDRLKQNQAAMNPPSGEEMAERREDANRVAAASANATATGKTSDDVLTRYGSVKVMPAAAVAQAQADYQKAIDLQTKLKAAHPELGDANSAQNKALLAAMKADPTQDLQAAVDKIYGRPTPSTGSGQAPSTGPVGKLAGTAVTATGVGPTVAQHKAEAASSGPAPTAAQLAKNAAHYGGVGPATDSDAQRKIMDVRFDHEHGIPLNKTDQAIYDQFSKETDAKFAAHQAQAKAAMDRGEQRILDQYYADHPGTEHLTVADSASPHEVIQGAAESGAPATPAHPLALQPRTGAGPSPIADATSASPSPVADATSAPSEVGQASRNWAQGLMPPLPNPGPTVARASVPLEDRPAFDAGAVPVADSDLLTGTLPDEKYGAPIYSDTGSPIRQMRQGDPTGVQAARNAYTSGQMSASGYTAATGRTAPGAAQSPQNVPTSLISAMKPQTGAGSLTAQTLPGQTDQSSLTNNADWAHTFQPTMPVNWGKLNSDTNSQLTGPDSNASSGSGNDDPYAQWRRMNLGGGNAAGGDDTTQSPASQFQA